MQRIDHRVAKSVDAQVIIVANLWNDAHPRLGVDAVRIERPREAAHELVCDRRMSSSEEHQRGLGMGCQQLRKKRVVVGMNLEQGLRT